MRFISLNYSFDSFAVETKFEELDTKAIAFFEKRINESGRFLSSGNLKEDFTKLGLIINGKLTRAAQLLFGTHYTGIHIGRFKARDVIIDDMVIRSPLVLAVEEAMNFIKRNIRLGYEFTGEIQRKEIWQFPLPALRELLLNAVVHKDYSNPTDVIIKIFDENIEISNPGRLLNELTIEDLKTDHYQAKHRNKLLTEMFYLMGDIEKYGTGYARLRNWLKEYPNIQYTLVDLIDFFRIEFVEKIDRAQETHQETHQENIDKVLELVKLMENKKYSSKELMDLLKLSDIVNFRVLYRTPAQKAGYITMLYPDNPKHRNQQYFLTEKGMQTKTAIRK
jgi:ATP-dependent DNA helicase RecG